MPEDFYDHLLWKQVERLHEEKGVFSAGLLIGSVLEYQIGVWDSWLAYRVKTFIEQGLLEIAEEAEDGWIYQTKLRKVNDDWISTRTEGYLRHDIGIHYPPFSRVEAEFNPEEPLETGTYMLRFYGHVNGRVFDSETEFEIDL